MTLKIVWRNLWRNRKRTLITMASVYFAVILAVFTRSMQLGSYDRIIQNVAGYYTGYLQVHEKGYWEEQTLEYSFLWNDTVTSLLDGSEEVLSWVPRLKSYALVSGPKVTRGLRIIGTDPAREDAMTGLKAKLTSGRYFEPGREEILIGEGVATHLNLSVGDTVVVLGQGYHAVSAAGKYPVAGIVKFPTAELNNNLVYLPLETAQYLFGAEGRLTSVAVMLHNRDELAPALNRLQASLPTHYEVLSWKELMPDLDQAIRSDNAGGIIMLAVLFLIIAFGVFGTILMMLNERRREFAILVAIGMKKRLLARIVVLETVLIVILGTFAGMISSIPVIEYFKFHPIKLGGDVAEAYAKWGFEPVMPFTDKPSIFIGQTVIVLLVALVIALYPMLKIRRLNIMEAMRS